MFNLFSSLPLKNKNITAGYLQTLLQVQARDLFTGLIHISDGAAKRGVLFYVQGVGILFYVFEGGHWKSVSRAQISTELEKLAGDVFFLALPSEGMRILRLFMDVDTGELNTF